MADGRRNNRGTKGNKGGRPSKSEEMQLIEKLNQHIDNDKVIQILKDKIEEGDFKALTLYMHYYYGKPVETKNISVTEDKPIFDL
jgi:hypothetical protein